MGNKHGKNKAIKDGFVETKLKNGLTRYDYYENGIKIQEKFILNGQLHRSYGPAKTNWDEHGSKVQEEWYLHGKLHRKNGPARTMWWEKITIEQEWYFKGERHRTDGPARNITRGALEISSWYYKGKLHRNNSNPAYVETYYGLNGWPVNIKEYRYKLGKLHNKNGPAIIMRYPNGNIRTEQWWLNNELSRYNPNDDDYFLPVTIEYSADGSITKKLYDQDGILVEDPVIVSSDSETISDDSDNAEEISDELSVLDNVETAYSMRQTDSDKWVKVYDNDKTDSGKCSKANKLSDATNECAICLTVKTISNVTVLTSCGHTFHTGNCVNQVIKTGICSLCRAPIDGVQKLY